MAALSPAYATATPPLRRCRNCRSPGPPWPPLAPLGTENRDPHRDYTLYTDTCYLLLVRFYDLGNLSGIMAVAAVFLGAGQPPGSTGLWPYTLLDARAIGTGWMLLHSLIRSMVAGFGRIRCSTEVANAKLEVSCPIFVEP